MCVKFLTNSMSDYYFSPTISQGILCKCQRFSTIFKNVLKGYLNHAKSEMHYISLDEKTLFRGTQDAAVRRMSKYIGCISFNCERKRGPKLPFIPTRCYAPLRVADLDWIFGLGYSLGGYILEKNHETNVEP